MTGKNSLAVRMIGLLLAVTFVAPSGIVLGQDHGLPDWLNRYVAANQKGGSSKAQVAVKGLVVNDGRFYVSQYTKLYAVALPNPDSKIPIAKIKIRLDDSEWFQYSGSTLVFPLDNADLSIEATAASSGNVAANASASELDYLKKEGRKTGFFSIPPNTSGKPRVLKAVAEDFLGNSSEEVRLEIYVDDTKPNVVLNVATLDPLVGLADDIDPNAKTSEKSSLIEATRSKDGYYFINKNYYKITIDAFDMESGVETALPLSSLKDDNERKEKRLDQYVAGTIKISLSDGSTNVYNFSYLKPIQFPVPAETSGNNQLQSTSLIGANKNRVQMVVEAPSDPLNQFYLAPGFNFLKIEAVDRVGNKAERNFTIFVDIEKPKNKGPIGFIDISKIYDETANPSFKCPPVCPLPKDIKEGILKDQNNYFGKNYFIDGKLSFLTTLYGTLGGEIQGKLAGGAKDLQGYIVFANLDDEFAYIADDQESGSGVHSMYVRLDGASDVSDISGTEIRRPRFDNYKSKRTIKFSSSGLHGIEVKSVDNVGNVGTEVWFFYIAAGGPSTSINKQSSTN